MIAFRQLRAQAEEQRRQQRPKVLPHPKVIEGVLGDLSKLLESAPEQARAILKRFMPPVVLAPDGDGWKLSGGLDLEAVLDQGGAQQEVGGTGIEPATRAV